MTEQHAACPPYPWEPFNPIRAWNAFWGLVGDRDDTRYVFEFFRAVNGQSMGGILGRFVNSEFGRSQIEDRTRFAEKLLEDQSAKLRDDAYNEAKQSTEDTRIFLPGYLKSVETRQLGIAKELTVAAEKTASAEKELLKSFQESKTTQQVLERLSSELALEEERTITAQMDDAGRTLFLLKRNGQTEGQG